MQMIVVLSADFHKWLAALTDQKGVAVVVRGLQRIQRGDFSKCRQLGKDIFGISVHCISADMLYCCRRGGAVYILCACLDLSAQRRNIANAIELSRQVNGEANPQFIFFDAIEFLKYEETIQCYLEEACNENSAEALSTALISVARSRGKPVPPSPGDATLSLDLLLKLIYTLGYRLELKPLLYE